MRNNFNFRAVMQHPLVAFSLLALMSALSVGCGGKTFTLTVAAQTDLVPQQEFTGADLQLFNSDSDGLQHEAVGAPHRVTVGSSSWALPRTAFTTTALTKDAWYVAKVRLLDDAGLEVVHRFVAFQFTGTMKVTVVLTRNCVNAQCAAGTTDSCQDGTCVPATCYAEVSGTCPAATCATNGDCTAPTTACAVSLCSAAGVCIHPAANAAQCSIDTTLTCCNADTEWCNPDHGCVAIPIDAGDVDAGVGDAAMVDASDAHVDGAMDAAMDAAMDMAIVDAAHDANDASDAAHDMATHDAADAACVYDGSSAACGPTSSTVCQDPSMPCYVGHTDCCTGACIVDTSFTPIDAGTICPLPDAGMGTCNNVQNCVACGPAVSCLLPIGGGTVNQCHNAHVSCSTGLCVEDTASYRAGGVACDTDAYCDNAHHCAHCVLGAACSTGNDCRSAVNVFSPSTGCGCGPATNLNGTSCSAGFCDAGVCDPCVPNAICTVANSCTNGTQTCAGAKVCDSTLVSTNVAAGADAGTGFVCDGHGARVACSQGATCALDAGAGVIANCANTTYECSSGGPVCAVRSLHAVTDPGVANACSTSTPEAVCNGYDDTCQPVLEHVVSVAVGYDNACAIVAPTLSDGGVDYTAGGKVSCWGSNSSCALGTGSAVSNIFVPTAVDFTAAGSPAAIKQVAVGEYTSCALDVAGAVYCWGDGSAGELGATSGHPVEMANRCGISGTAAYSSSRALAFAGPASVTFSSLAVARKRWPGSIPCRVSGTFCNDHSYDYQFCGVTDAGDVWCWGEAQSGPIYKKIWNHLGGDNIGHDAAPIAKQVAIGDGLWCVRSANMGGTTNEIFCMGDGEYGQHGDAQNQGVFNGGSDAEAFPPLGTVAPVSTAGGVVTDAIDISVAGEAACAARANGSMICWGTGASGNPLTWPGATDGVRHDGSHFTAETVNSLVSTPLTGVESVSVSGQLTCARTGGKLLCFGASFTGRLCPPLTTCDTTKPAFVEFADPNPTTGIGTPVDVTMVGGFSVGDANDSVATSDRPTGCLIFGPKHQLYCWGANGHGTLGINDGINAPMRPTPVPVYASLAP